MRPTQTSDMNDFGRSVGDFEIGFPTDSSRGSTESESQRTGGSPLFADHVAEIIGVHVQLEARVRAHGEKLHLNVIGMIDEAARHENRKVAKLEVVRVGFASARGPQGAAGFGRTTGTGTTGFGRITGTVESLAPTHRKSVVHRTDSPRAGNGWLRLRTARPLAHSATPPSHRRRTVLV